MQIDGCMNSKLFAIWNLFNGEQVVSVYPSNFITDKILIFKLNKKRNPKINTKLEVEVYVYVSL